MRLFKRNKRNNAAAFSFVTIIILLGFVFSCIVYAQEDKKVGADEQKSAVQQEAQENKVIVEEDGQGAYYTVKKGDTLWGISKKFLNSPWYWPELWEVNSDVPILNPHLIFPGQRIRLFRRGDMPGQAAQIPAQIPAVPQAPSATAAEPLDVDPSLAGVSEFGDDIKGKYYNYSLINQAGFILKQPYEPKGRIFKVQDDKEMISDGDLVYIRGMNNNSFSQAQKYTLYRRSNLLKNEETGVAIGYQHRMLGILEITRIEPDFVMANVIHTYHPIKVGDFLMPYENRSPKVVFTGSLKGMSGTVVGSEDNETMLGEHSIGFIDKGQLDGIAPGQQYKVYFRETAKPDPAANKKIVLPPADFATLLVLLSTPNYSTFLVTYSERSIHIGAKFHGPM